MQRFKNILVFTDGGPRGKAVLERAAVLAQENKARLTALSVIESLPYELQQLIAAAHPADLWELAVNAQKQKLAGLVQRVCKANVDAATKVLEGSPFVEVIKEVLRHKHDLVMMAAEGKGGVETPVTVFSNDRCGRMNASGSGCLQKQLPSFQNANICSHNWFLKTGQ